MFGYIFIARFYLNVYIEIYFILLLDIQENWYFPWYF